MKKEVLIAILSGLILGLIVTAGIYTANKSIEQQKIKKSANEQTSPVPSSPANNADKQLTITSHQPFDLIDQSEVTIAGIAWPQAVVALMTENDNQLVTADNEGVFSFTTNLIKGFNEITVVATDNENNTQTTNLTLTYSTSDIQLTASPAPEE